MTVATLPAPATARLASIYQAHLGVYWLLLGVWVGSLVMLAITAAITFHTVRTEYKPTLTQPPYDQAALIAHGPDILAGGIVGNVIEGLAVVQGVCVAGLVVCLLLQSTAFSRFIVGSASNRTNLFRVMLIVLPILVYGAERTVLTPEIWHQRRIMYDPVVSDETRAKARATFDAFHRISERLVGTSMFLLIAAALVSPLSLIAAPQGTREPAPPVS